MTQPQEFLSLVDAAVLARGVDVNYRADALKVAGQTPDSISAWDAAGMIIRWLYEEPLLDKDGLIWGILAPEFVARS